MYAHTRSRGFGREVQKRILLGTYALTAEYVSIASGYEQVMECYFSSAFDNYFLQAQRVRQLVRDDFNRVFLLPGAVWPHPKSCLDTPVHVLIHPSVIRTAPPLVSTGKDLDAYVQDVLTVPASLAGLPALTVPVTPMEGDGWPVGVSIVGQWGSDQLVLRVGEIIQRVASGRMDGDTSLPL